MFSGLSLAFISTHTGFQSHSRGLFNSFESISAFGMGLGGAGNVSVMYAAIKSGIGDSFVGALLGQVGFIGCVIWFLILLYKLKESYLMSRTITLLLVTQLALGFLSENSFNFLSIFPAAFFCGYIVRSKLNVNN
jgi:Ca2+/Na+ antiporter